MLAVAVGVLAQLYLSPLWSPRFPFLTFYPAIMVTAWLGGLGPGLLATLLSGAATAAFWLPALAPPVVARWADWPALGLFTGIGALMSSLTASLRKANERLRADADHIVRLNRELQRRVTELQTLLDVIPIGIAIAHDPECRVITGNPALERMLGMPPGKNLSKSAPPGEAPPFRLYRDGRELSADELPMQVAAARGVVTSSVELDVVWPDGTTRKLLEWAAPLFDEQGKTRGCFLAVVDITERKKAEVALRETTARFEAFMDHLPALAYLKDEAGRYLYVNRGWQHATGRSSADGLGRTDFDLFPAEVAAQWRANDMAVLEGSRTVEVEETFPRTDGLLSYLSFKFPVSDADGRRLVGGISIDVTERKRAEDERTELLAREQAARSEAEAAVRTREAFLARASHELRTPLTSALGTIRLLKKAMAGRLKASPDELIEIAGRNLDAMLALVNDLLDASKLAAGREPLTREAVEVATVAGASLDVVGAQAGEKGVAVRTAVPPGLTVLGDARKLEQVLMNLLANAVKFTPPGGQVVVEAGAEEDGVVIRVRDTGEGIAAEHLERIFEPFFRAAERRAQQPRGTGLGLAICRQIVALHGGRIWAESEGPGRGATFVVRLPAAPLGSQAA